LSQWNDCLYCRAPTSAFNIKKCHASFSESYHLAWDEVTSRQHWWLPILEIRRWSICGK